MAAQAATSKVQEALNTPFDFRMIGSETAPASTQIIFRYSSSPKSAMSLAFWSQGFQTTVSGKFFLIIFTVEPFSLQECFSPVFLYTLSVALLMQTNSAVSVFSLFPSTLSRRE
uniref:Uncharacterized protein n=1 Tax=Ixodes ricinus TaxID=34613 RepID=A0A0K8RD09_IXORI